MQESLSIDANVPKGSDDSEMTVDECQTTAGLQTEIFIHLP
jgi:hypothetical protein